LIRKITQRSVALVFLLTAFTLWGQQNKKDSLVLLLKKDKEDTLKVKHLNDLAWALGYTSPDSSILLSSEALRLSRKIHWLPGVANSYHQLGHFQDNKGDYSLALQLYYKVLDTWDSVPGSGAGNRARKLSTLNNIGIVYEDQGNYAKAVEFFFEALKSAESLQDKNKMAIVFTNLGTVYKNQKNFEKALDYYAKALSIAEEAGDQAKIAIHLGNIGSVYVGKKEYDKGLDLFLRALKIDSSAGNSDGISRHLGNIAVVYDEQKNYEKALTFYFRSLEIKKKIAPMGELAGTLGNIGSLYLSQGNYIKAEEYLLQALTIDTLHGDFPGILEVSANMSQLYERTGKPAKALVFYKLAMNAKDTLFNQAKNREMVMNEMNYEFNKKEVVRKVEQEKKDVLAAAEKRRNRLVVLFSIFGLLVALAFILYILNRWKVDQRYTKTIEEQKLLVEEKSKIVTEKNKSILDSINYAKRIQEALLIPEEGIKKEFADAFVLFSPKDIVSGDFYWFAESRQNKILAVADCTGHGVPGGFMSVLGFEMLQETLLLENVRTTAAAFSALDIKITETLNRNSRSYRDGMDMVLCAFNKTGRSLQFSCANRPLLLIRNGVLQTFTPDKHTIGGAIDDVKKEFTTQKVDTLPGDQFYLFSDGYADQFGGPNNKKLKYKHLIETLLANHQRPMAEQRSILERVLKEWMGSNEQTDDVLVIGLKV